jgi:hypothetical protein
VCFDKRKKEGSKEGKKAGWILNEGQLPAALSRLQILLQGAFTCNMKTILGLMIYAAQAGTAVGSHWLIWISNSGQYISCEIQASSFLFKMTTIQSVEPMIFRTQPSG